MLGDGFDAQVFRRQLEDMLRGAAAAADAGYPDNEGLVIDPETGIPSLKPHRPEGLTPSAKRLEQEIKARMPERTLIGILSRTAYWVQWWRRFGPASGNEPKLADPFGRYVLTTFVKGTNMGPYEAARHIPGVSGHELSYTANRHFSIVLLNEAIADLVNAHARLDISQAWGDGTAAAADGTHMDTYLDNLLAETSVRYGKPGGIAYHHISDTYIALFTHFIPCGVWEAVYIIEGLLKNTSEVQPTTVHADTQGQSQPVFALAHLLGFDLMPRIRNWKGMTFYRPSKQTEYVHIDALFGEPGKNTIDFDLIESQFRHLMRVAVSVREGAISSSTLLKRLRSGSKKNATYAAFREVGRVIRTVQLSVTWNLAVAEIISVRYDHGLRRCVGHGGAGGEVAGARQARASGRVVAGVDRPGAGAPDDRRLCPRIGRVPGDVRAGERRPADREPGPHRRLCTGVDLKAESSGCECGLNRLGLGPGQRHHPAAPGAGPAVLRLPHGRRTA
ncbi:Tn3 family transposase [Streptomyces sp. NPDC058424]|uniref:Tn3 family transposase n=1 Tax=Streptomyces sp. NPDC058424 TaxID=3346491 RepID=UPI003663B3D4